ncbi:histidine triad nucleotide-binding protein [Leptospira idonii]|uniref:Histidine triad nucleotide-binding protein n=1 Tax=Leptospira idonii TaxID=1193500 RepID=A0A4R9LYD5_9LEPT|nr:histidine triad nucleotide-binding protein [Leptospira idonii]TGN19333.1 histidine triad nucleotide-binding protein [Leptospira idonii]
MTNENCIFCKIAKGEIPAKIEYQDEDIIAFHDITPQAPLHLLVIPKTHIASANEINSENSRFLSKIFETIPKLTKSFGVNEKGYRVVNNCGDHGGQTVHHIHFHVLGGRHLAWPPG